MLKNNPTAYKSLLFITLLCLTILSSCNESNESMKVNAMESEEKSDTLSFQIAEHYFAKNKVESIYVEKVESKERFNELFGMAAVMGMDTSNFPINFNSNYVLAVIIPDTDLSKSITPISLVKKSDKNIMFNYKIETGEEQTFITRPCLVIIVSQQNNGNVIFKSILKSK